MLLVLSEQHKEHLSFLSAVEPAVVAEFGRIALDFLRRGTSPKIYEAAARKLSVSVESVQHGVEGLMFLILESCKHMLSEVDFLDSVLVLGFSNELVNDLLKLYLQHCSHVRIVLSRLTLNLPAYHNLEWRLDVHMASRSLRQQLVPVLTVRLCLSRGEGTGAEQRRLFQTQPGTLLHLISSLEDALAAMKSSHTRRILRNIK